MLDQRSTVQVETNIKLSSVTTQTILDLLPMKWEWTYDGPALQSWSIHLHTPIACSLLFKEGDSKCICSVIQSIIPSQMHPVTVILSSSCLYDTLSARLFKRVGPAIIKTGYFEVLSEGPADLLNRRSSVTFNGFLQILKSTAQYRSRFPSAKAQRILHSF